MTYRTKLGFLCQEYIAVAGKKGICNLRKCQSMTPILRTYFSFDPINGDGKINQRCRLALSARQQELRVMVEVTLVLISCS